MMPKDTISANMQGYRAVAVGNTIHFDNKWRLFPDFLGCYLHALLGSGWGNIQLQLAEQHQHPIIQWREKLASLSQTATRNAQGLICINTGAANAWFRLAYDLYLIQHNSALQSKLVRRLKDARKFQGARFEVTVAAMMLTAGYHLRFSKERGPGKHPEFWATHATSGRRIAVEAKSRHRNGSLGFQLAKSEPDSEVAKVDSLLNRALEKDLAEPLLIFIEINLPLTLHNNSLNAFVDELNDAWSRAQGRWPPDKFPAIGVVFYNDVSPWYLDDPLPDKQAGIWAVTFWSKNCKFDFDRVGLLTNITQAVPQRCHIPMYFPL